MLHMEGIYDVVWLSKISYVALDGSELRGTIGKFSCKISISMSGYPLLREKLPAMLSITQVCRVDKVHEKTCSLFGWLWYLYKTQNCIRKLSEWILECDKIA